MVYEEKNNAILLRVRLSPNSSCCKINGVFEDAEGLQYLKINVVSIASKGKANQELISFLAKLFKLAKSEIEIVSGELVRYKKLCLKTEPDKIKEILDNIG